MKVCFQEIQIHISNNYVGLETDHISAEVNLLNWILKYSYYINLNPFPTCGDFRRLLIIYANSLDPDQAQQNVGPNLDQLFDTLMVFLKDFFEKVKKIIHRRQKSMQNYPAC